MRALAALLFLVTAAGCAQTAATSARDETMRGYAYYDPAPRLDAGRKVSEHDCTRPLPSDGGNLRCI